MTEKLLRCPTCQTQKDADDFYKDCTRASGRAVTCKSCHTQASKRRRAVLSARTEEELIRDTPEFKRCSGKCKQTKPAAEFARSRGVKSGLKGICRSCAAEVWREWSAKNKKKKKKAATA